MSFPGLHVLPKRNSANPIFFIAGSPLAKRNIHISITATTDMKALIKKIAFMMFSFTLLLFLLLKISVSYFRPLGYFADVNLGYFFSFHAYCRIIIINYNRYSVNSYYCRFHSFFNFTVFKSS